jgi:DNA-binding NarL/FixJ family response regulator
MNYPSALSERERRVVDHARRGHANKRIAVELGLAQSTVSEILRDAGTKLGVGSRLELVRLLAPAATPAWPGSLTQAERAIAALLIEGASNAEIASRRGTSARTVVNQVASIFKKACVASRIELAARLFGADAQNQNFVPWRMTS